MLFKVRRVFIEAQKFFPYPCIEKNALIGFAHVMDHHEQVPDDDNFMQKIGDYCGVCKDEALLYICQLANYKILDLKEIDGVLTFSISQFFYDAKPLIRGGECSQSLRRRVYRAFSSCEYCGGENIDPSIDRIIPGILGGAYVPDNVTLSCRSCNTKKKDRDYIGPVRSLAIMEARK